MLCSNWFNSNVTNEYPQPFYMGVPHGVCVTLNVVAFNDVFLATLGTFDLSLDIEIEGSVILEKGSL